jgi:hypothetical protein
MLGGLRAKDIGEPSRYASYVFDNHARRRGGAAPWMCASGHNGDIKRAAHGYEPTREVRWRRSRSHGDGDEKGYTGSGRGCPMSTTVLAYLILFVGFGAFGLLILLFEEVSKTERVQFRYSGMAAGLIAGDLAMLGIGRGLLLLLLILSKP